MGAHKTYIKMIRSQGSKHLNTLCPQPGPGDQGRVNNNWSLGMERERQQCNKHTCDQCEEAKAG